MQNICRWLATPLPMTMTMGMLATAAKNSSHSAAEKLTHAESGNSNVKKTNTNMSAVRPAA